MGRRINECVNKWMHSRENFMYVWMDEEEVEWRGERIDDWLYKRLGGYRGLLAEWTDKRTDG